MGLIEHVPNVRPVDLSQHAAALIFVRTVMGKVAAGTISHK